jgi:3-deoxy-D-manno-octulosonate 8-phosphate phosphatase (KDO 8-P phosphatase)
MNLLEKFREIHTFIFDVDGVFTNSDLIVLENGALLRKMNVRDGYAVKRAIQEGYRVCIITGGSSEGVTSRLKGLGIPDIYTGISNKLDTYEEYIITYELDSAEILYMGDDIPDYEAMRLAGLPCCPNDAANEIIEISQYISPKKGGDGCVRDVIEKVLKLHGKWFDESPLPQADVHSSQKN